MIEKCQKTQCIVVCCIWGCTAIDQSGSHVADPCPTPKMPIMGTWVSKLDHRESYKKVA